MEMFDMKTVTVRNAQKDFYRLLNEVNESHIPVHIAGKRNSAVLLSEEDWKTVCEIVGIKQDDKADF